MKIREAKEQDLPAIVQLLSQDPLGSQRERFETPLPQSYRSAFFRITNDPNQELMVGIDEQGAVIATMQLSFLQYLTYQGGLRAQIEAVRVRNDVRSQGIGTQLFNWAIDRARSKSAHVLQLTTDKQRPKALHFYESLGFKASHEGLKMHLGNL